MKKVFLMLMVAVAFMACENVPGGNSGVPTKDAKAVAASTSGAVELLGKDAAAVDKALLAAGYEKVEMTYNAVPARLKKAFKEETNATYYYVFGYPKDVEKMTEEELIKYQQELFGKGGAMSAVYVTFDNNVLSNMQTQVAVGMSKKTNLLYTDISDLLFAELPKTDSLRQWRGAVYGAGEDGENQFEDHAAYVAKVAATNGIEAQEMGEGLYPETKTAKGYYCMWYAPDPENPQPARVIAADNDSATTEEPTNNEVLYAMGMFSVAQSAYNPEEKPDQPTGDFSVNIAIADITATGATITTTPSDNETYYYWTVVDAQYLDYFTADSIAEMLVAADIEDGYTFEDLYGVYVVTGTDTYTYSSLSPETEYAVIAFPVNEELEVIGGASTKLFTTIELEKKGEETLNIAEGEYMYASDYGYLIVAGYTTDDKYYLSLMAYPAESMTTAITDENVYAYYTYLVEITGEGDDDYEEYSLSNVNLRSEAQADGSLTVTGTFMATNGVEYTLNMIATETADEGYDAPKRAKAVKMPKVVKRAVRK